MIKNLREHELSELLNVTRGAGSDTVVVTGPAGSGRTALLSSVAGATTISTSIVRANPTEKDWRFSGLSAFLAAVDDAVGTSLRSLVTLSADERSAFAVAEDLDASLRTRTFDAFAVIVDDADLMDPTSLEVIGFLLRRRSIKNLRAILAVQSIGGSGPLSSFTRVGRPQSAQGRIAHRTGPVLDLASGVEERPRNRRQMECRQSEVIRIAALSNSSRSAVRERSAHSSPQTRNGTAGDSASLL